MTKVKAGSEPGTGTGAAPGPAASAEVAAGAEAEALIREARLRQRRRYLVTGLAVAAAVAAVAGGLMAAGGPEGPGRPPRAPAAQVPAAPPPIVRPVRVAPTRVPAGAVDVAVGDGAVWVSGFGAVSRLDPVTDRVTARITTPGTDDFSQIAEAKGSIWVTGDRGTVYRIDPVTNRVVATIHLGGIVKGIAVGAGRVWVARTDGTGELVRIDPQTNEVAGPAIKVGPDPAEVTYGLGAVWVNDESTYWPYVMRVDPATGRVSRVPVAGYGLTVGYGSLWAVWNGSLTRFDPAAGKVVATIHVPRALRIAIGAGEVWVLGYPRSRSPARFEPVKHTAALWEVDPRANRITGKAHRFDAQEPIAITASNRSAWIADYPGDYPAKVTRFRLLSLNK